MTDDEVPYVPSPVEREREKLADAYEALEQERRRLKHITDEMESELRSVQRQREHASFEKFVHQICQQASQRKNGN